MRAGPPGHQCLLPDGSHAPRTLPEGARSEAPVVPATGDVTSTSPDRRRLSRGGTCDYRRKASAENAPSCKDGISQLADHKKVRPGKLCESPVRRAGHFSRSLAVLPYGSVRCLRGKDSQNSVSAPTSESGLGLARASRSRWTHSHEFQNQAVVDPATRLEPSFQKLRSDPMVRSLHRFFINRRQEPWFSGMTGDFMLQAFWGRTLPHSQIGLREAIVAHETVVVEEGPDQP